VRPMDREKFEEGWHRIDTFHYDVKVHIGTHDYIGYIIANRYKIHTDKYYGYTVVTFYNDRNQGYDTLIADIALADISSIEKF
jgi:hypothetical protein